MDIISIICIFCLYGILTAIGIFIVLSITIYVTTKPYPVLECYEKEEFFYNPSSNSNITFPSIKDACSVNLSVVIPAYNEEDRLPPMLDEALEFLQRRVIVQPSFKYEIIVVSDGSSDGTVKVAHSYAMKHGSETVRCLELVKNRGKGGAVRMGIFSSRGATILFADADGASRFEDLTKLEAALSDLTSCEPITQPTQVADKVAVVIGSRAHLEEESLATRSLFRNILMYGFHFLVWLFTVRGIKDTQCGFKLFTRQAARICFQNLHVNRWAFDVELLYIAQKLNIPIAEIPIRWTEIDGSKVTPVISWIQMGCDLGLIWLRYTLGAWKIKADKIQ